MLVLSRRPDEKILLPTVPAVLKVISSQAGLVRLGIEAPAHVPILREELYRGEKSPLLSDSLSTSDTSSPSPTVRHAVRNRLNNLVLGLTLLRMRLVNCDAAVRETLDGMETELQELRLHLAGPANDPVEPVGESKVSPDTAPV